MIRASVCLCLLITVTGLVQAGTPHRYQAMLERESLRSGVPVALLAAVIRAESSFRPKVVSPKGAQGLMQLMPATAERFGVQDAFDPAQNIRGGSQYLAWLYRRYQHWPWVLAAYNAGEKAVDRYGGIPPYRETRNYVRKVLSYYAEGAGPPDSPGKAQGRVVPSVLQPGGKPYPEVRPEQRNREAEARASSVFF